MLIFLLFWIMFWIIFLLKKILGLNDENVAITTLFILVFLFFLIILAGW